jgi:hypothetical protein
MAFNNLVITFDDSFRVPDQVSALGSQYRIGMHWRAHNLVHRAALQDTSFDQSDIFEINLATGGNGQLFRDEYWSGPEAWGAWTDATQATLTFSMGEPRDLWATVLIRGLVSAVAPKQLVSIQANRCQLGSAEFDSTHIGPQVISGAIPGKCVNSDGRVILHISTDRVLRPKDIGINDDIRRLGVGVERVLVRKSIPLKN